MVKQNTVQTKRKLTANTKAEPTIQTGAEQQNKKATAVKKQKHNQVGTPSRNKKQNK